MPSQSDIDSIKTTITNLENNYKVKMDNLKKSEKILDDSKNTYNHYFYYTLSISIGALYLTRFIYLRMNKK
mgnify:CR=1 FL=1